MDVFFGISLLLKLVDQPVLTQLNESLKILQKLLFTHESPDCLREHSNRLDGRNQLNIIVLLFKNCLELPNDYSENLFVYGLIDRQPV